MGTPGRGHKSWIQFDEEGINTYGSIVVPTHKMEVISMDISPQVGVIRDPSLNNAVSRRGIYQGGKLFKGRFVVRCNYNGMGILLKAALGQVSDGGTTPAFTHTFKENADLRSLTIQMIEGDVPVNQYQVLSGALITGLTIRGNAGQGDDAMLQAEFEVLAKDKANVASVPTNITNWPAVNPVLFHHASLVDNGTNDAGSDIRVRSFEVTYRNALSEDRFYLGSANMDQPLRNDFVSCEWRITSEFQTINQFNYAAGFTEGSPELEFTGPVNTDKLRIRSSAARITEYSNPIEGYGVILSTAKWEAYYSTANADNGSLCIISTNAQALYDTAN